MSFNNRELRKEIYKRSCLRNRFWKYLCKKMRFCSKLKEVNGSRYGERALKFIFMVLLRKVF